MVKMINEFNYIIEMCSIMNCARKASSVASYNFRCTVRVNMIHFTQNSHIYSLLNKYLTLIFSRVFCHYVKKN